MPTLTQALKRTVAGLCSEAARFRKRICPCPNKMLIIINIINNIHSSRTVVLKQGAMRVPDSVLRHSARSHAPALGPDRQKQQAATCPTAWASSLLRLVPCWTTSARTRTHTHTHPQKHSVPCAQQKRVQHVRAPAPLTSTCCWMRLGLIKGVPKDALR